MYESSREIGKSDEIELETINCMQYRFAISFVERRKMC